MFVFGRTAGSVFCSVGKQSWPQTAVRQFRFTTNGKLPQNVEKGQRRLLQVRRSAGDVRTAVSAGAARCFHTSARCSAPPLFWLLFKPIAKISAVISGRVFRKWWKVLPKEKRGDIFAGHLRRHYGKYLGMAAVIGGTVTVYYFTHLQRTPITNRERFIAFTSDQFSSIADVEYNMHLEQFGEDLVGPDHPGYQLVSNVTNWLVKNNQDIPQVRDITWTVHVVNQPVKNAFVLPHGQIFVFGGMLETVTNPHQLGIILGHEMAHAILGHAAEQVSFLQLVDCLSICVVAAIWAFFPSDWMALLSHWLQNKFAKLLLEMPYSRMLETEADEVGLQLAAKACFDVRESAAFWERMALQDDMDEKLDLDWLSTHPTHDTRAQHLEQLLPQAIELRKSCQCLPLSSEDPILPFRTLREGLKTGAVQTAKVLIRNPLLETTTQGAPVRANKLTDEKSS
ncbi:metalloendopeptidase OMA1, mitochondrial-like [Branchiostoma floridae]|uniref:Metalloendopeptidase OMA1, mitochondrial n=1 Tax=Branchiostoma floridae TaxID=7739 RepID=A0A9J7NCY0_BRAFL|nr:metalloendopeptidase OMA1, mitochondrial-like [Branchiostoma floridae]